MKFYKRYKAAVYAPNLYSLLQYLLLEPYEVKDTLFFIHGRFPVSVAHRLPCSEFLVESSKFNRLLSLVKIHWLVLRNRNLTVFLGGHLGFTDVFLGSSKNCIYLEDGGGSYEEVCNNKEKQRMLEKRKRTTFWGRLIMGDLYPWFGLADNVRKIYLTGLLPVPEIIADKVELINLKQLWLHKSKEQQEEIIRLFLSPDFDRNIIRRYKVLLLTQSFSEYSVNGFSEEDKIEVYRKLVSRYDESELVIKTHPEERTDYAHYFPKARILNQPCPMELLFFMGFYAKTAISVNSTSIFGMDNFEEKIISGYDVTPALKKEAMARGIYGGISNKSVHITK